MTIHVVLETQRKLQNVKSKVVAQPLYSPDINVAIIYFYHCPIFLFK